MQSGANNDQLNVLPGGASVTMTNQPSSHPFLVLSRGETLTNFMSRVEDQRGIPMSKSGIEHIQIKFPTKVNKKRSFLSKFFLLFFECIVYFNSQFQMNESILKQRK